MPVAELTSRLSDVIIQLSISPFVAPSANPSPTVQPSAAASPFIAPSNMPSCSGVIAPLAPGNEANTSLLGGGQGIGVGTMTLTNGNLVLTPGTGDYFFSEFYAAGGGCFDASNYAMLRVGVQLPPGGAFSIGVQLYDTSCANNAATHYFGFSTSFGVAAGGAGILTIPITPELSNLDLKLLKNILITGFSVTGTGVTYNITGIQLDNCGVNGGGPCSRDIYCWTISEWLDLMLGVTT